LVAGHHVEVGTGEIAFIGIVRLKNHGIGAVPGKGIASNARDTIVKRRVAHHPQGIVAFGHVGISIRGVQVIDISVGCVYVPTPPTFGKGVFPVHTPTAGAYHIGIHVPDAAVVPHVGGFEKGPQAVVVVDSMIEQQVGEGGFEGFAFFAVDGIVIPVGVGRP